MRETRLESVRISCGKAIEKLGDKYTDLIHITSDGNDYTKRNRKRHFDVGIAESNLINVATGFAIKGFPVIVNGITSFVLYNAYLQIRNDLCYPNHKVIIMGIGSGLSYGHLGFSHHSPEDIATLYTLPNMKIYLPCDASEASAALDDALKREGPSFVRVRTGMEPLIYEPKQVKAINFDSPVLLKKGNDALIISYGTTLYNSLQASEELDKLGISCSVINLNALKIYDISKLLEYIDGYKSIIVVEEHYVDTGVGSIITNKLADKVSIPILKMGISNEFVKFGGNGAELLSYYKLDSDSIKEKVINSLK